MRLWQPAKVATVAQRLMLRLSTPEMRAQSLEWQTLNMSSKQRRRYLRRSASHQ
jgi:hypothetical protein